MKKTVMALVALAAAVASAANTWWVAKEDPNASDSNPGTEALPFRTINAAANNPDIAANDTINVKPGVYDEGGQVAACEVAQTLALERDSGARGGGHCALACGGDADDHVDGRDLTLGLKEGSADLGHTLCHVGGNFGLRGYRVTEVMTAACLNSGFREGFIALHQYFFCHFLSPTFLP